MFPGLKNHPFAVKAFFDSSLVLTYAVPKEQLQRFIPDCLELDTFQDKYAFVAVAMVQTKQLRPAVFPAFMGNDFFLIGYRIFVRYRNKAGKHLRGLYILKSETNKKKMELLGNVFTHYNYTTTDIQEMQSGNVRAYTSVKSGFKVTLDLGTGVVSLPTGSPFADWKEARRFAGPLPYTFEVDAVAKRVLIIEGMRQHWTPTPIKVLDHRFPFLDSLQLEGAVLANAFGIYNVPYYWKKGKTEVWE